MWGDRGDGSRIMTRHCKDWLTWALRDLKAVRGRVKCPAPPRCRALHLYKQPIWSTHVGKDYAWLLGLSTFDDQFR
jgi:hypothetical protein